MAVVALIFLIAAFRVYDVFTWELHDFPGMEKRDLARKRKMALTGRLIFLGATAVLLLWELGDARRLHETLLTLLPVIEPIYTAVVKGVLLVASFFVNLYFEKESEKIKLL